MFENANGIKSILEILASDSDVQENYIYETFKVSKGDDPKGEMNVDELGLVFDDELRYFISKNAEKIDYIQMDDLKAISRYLDSFSNECFREFWSVYGLREDFRWNEVRKLANKSLKSLNLINK